MSSVIQESNVYQLLHYAGTVVGLVDLVLLTAVLSIYLTGQIKGLKG